MIDNVVIVADHAFSGGEGRVKCGRICTGDGAHPTPSGAAATGGERVYRLPDDGIGEPSSSTMELLWDSVVTCYSTSSRLPCKRRCARARRRRGLTTVYAGVRPRVCERRGVNPMKLIWRFICVDVAREDYKPCADCDVRSPITSALPPEWGFMGPDRSPPPPLRAQAVYGRPSPRRSSDHFICQYKTPQHKKNMKKRIPGSCGQGTKPRRRPDVTSSTSTFSRSATLGSKLAIWIIYTEQAFVRGFAHTSVG
ncbi:hypothetical protein EVAR_20363_1 [Eumeta japonica]|uniref:Uncharacterized protein n=1 Tax=Eumeta variegata TaxID=151549 RepID=A0A4C1VUQ6_EUMVA|nr:hypothetical protein EVAR_20363_1 [Eumeta japonica]